MTLEPRVATPVPDSDLTITLLGTRPYQPRHENPQDGSFVEHELATAKVELRHGDATTTTALWHDGPNDDLGPAWTVTIGDDDRVVLTRR